MQQQGFESTEVLTREVLDAIHAASRLYVNAAVRVFTVQESPGAHLNLADVVQS